MSNNNYTIKNKQNKYAHKKYQVWLAHNVEILLHNVDEESEMVDTTTLTIEASTPSELVARIEKEWGILCSFDELIPVYEFKEYEHQEGAFVRGYLLATKLDRNELDMLKEKQKNAKFVYYRDLYDLVKQFDRSDSFNEAFYSLLSVLENKHGPSGMLVWI